LSCTYTYHYFQCITFIILCFSDIKKKFWFCICCIYLAERIFVEYSLTSSRVVSVFNFQIIQMSKFVYFLQIKQFHSRTLTTALVGIKIKCYLTFTHVPINFIVFLEIAFQRLRMNIFTVKYIRTLHVQISLFWLKCTPFNYLCTLDVKREQFVVANYLPIHIEGVFYIRFERIFARSFGRTMVNVWDVGSLFMDFNPTLISVQSILLLTHIILSRETFKVKGKYNYHPIKFHLTSFIALQRESLRFF
jgi:hypothetical protein